MATPALSFLPILLVFLLLSSCPHPSSSMDCDKGDRAALLRAKKHFGNPPKLSSWLPATNCCTWDNVDCADTGRVDSIFLADFESNSSTVPPDLGDLSALQVLQIVNISGLAGHNPLSTFKRLSNLLVLHISFTSLSGPIPAGIRSLANLTFLLLAHNKLSGTIPPALSKLNLSYVDFLDNELSGPIPPGLLHGPRQYLTLSRNKLTGKIPRSYGKGDLDFIDVSHNKLTGDPSFLFGTAKPTTMIDLSWNKFHFDLTHAMFPRHLMKLDLSHNRIHGGVPRSLRDLNALSYLNLTYNDLCGEIPAGGAMASHGAECYLHNKCLCGAPLPPCHKMMLK